MLIRFDTPNGEMGIVVERFFPATKKDMKRLKKAVVDPNDLKKISEAISNLISQIEVFKNDSKARMEIHEMSMKEELGDSFKYRAEARKVIFYHGEYHKADEEIMKLKENKGAIDG